MPTSTQKRMIRHINQTVFELLYDYHFDEMTVQKFVKLPRLIVVPFIVISKINMIYSIPYPIYDWRNYDRFK